jgi:hypothetical protein
MTSDRRRSELEGSQLCAASFYLVIIMTSNLLNLTHTTDFGAEAGGNRISSGELRKPS